MILEGNWRNDHFEGRGRMITYEMIYEGEWKKGLQEGIGIESWADGSSFIGHFQNGQKYDGKIEWKNKKGEIEAVYSGGFKKDKMHG